MCLEDLKRDVSNGSADFKEVIEYIDAHYTFTPTAFTNGELSNAAGENSGSCKLFALASLNGLTREETLEFFGHYYRNHVLTNPKGTDHQNIRNFMRHGWEGLRFHGNALKPRHSA